jgi:tRNA-splicing ligase RtcB
MSNATNFAFVNRLCLAMTAVSSLEKTLGREIESSLLYDAPHNFIEADDMIWRHRKGATPALGPDQQHPSGHPVLVPGSMGDSSFILAGQGNPETACSTAHGAGRKLSRGAAASQSFDLSGLEIVTPVNEQEIINQGRRDLLAEKEKRLREEAPEAYKDINQVVESIEKSAAARPVVRLKPLLTVKS